MTVGGNEAGRPAGEATSVETAQALQLPKLSMPERELSHLPAGLVPYKFKSLYLQNL